MRGVLVIYIDAYRAGCGRDNLEAIGTHADESLCLACNLKGGGDDDAR